MAFCSMAFYHFQVHHASVRKYLKAGESPEAPIYLIPETCLVDCYGGLCIVIKYLKAGESPEAPIYLIPETCLVDCYGGLCIVIKILVVGDYLTTVVDYDSIMHLCNFLLFLLLLLLLLMSQLAVLLLITIYYYCYCYFRCYYRLSLSLLLFEIININAYLAAIY